jgi:hypothetical protein
MTAMFTRELAKHCNEYQSKFKEDKEEMNSILTHTIASLG